MSQQTKNVTFRMSEESLRALQILSDKFNELSRIRLSKGKILELIIFNAQSKSILDLLE